MKNISTDARRAPAPRHLTRQLLQLATLVLVLSFQLLAAQASAHELEMDSLAVRVDTESGEILGQFLLDPDLTRPGGAQTEVAGAEMEKERAALFSFIREHFSFQTGSQPLKLSLDLRELYVKGGAVPGDSVMYSAQLPENWSSLSVRIEKPLTQVAVTTSVDRVEKPTKLLSAAHPLLLQERKNAGAPSAEPANETVSEPESSQTLLKQALQHIWTGFIHIVPLGWDHILFVVALTLGSLGKYRRLFLELSAFTLAHTVTLGLGAMRIIVVPSSIIEPLIAFSIAAVAVEHLVAAENPRFRFTLVAGFGLLHGLGFAGALLNLGFSGQSFLLFLGSFNVGVELGQLVVVAASLVLFGLLSKWPKGQRITLRVLAFAICACGLLVGISRLLGPGGILGGH